MVRLDAIPEVDASTHPCFIPLLGAGKLDADTGYLVLAHMGLPTLDDLVEEGALELARGLGVVEQIARAMAAYHARGWLVIDLRPSEIYVHVQWGEERVLVPPHPALLHDRVRGGYCAPETDDPPFDARADQYTLGVLAFEVFTGATPHNPEAPPDARTPVLPSALDGLPEEVRPLVERLLQPEPEARYSSMEEVLEALQILPGRHDSYGQFTPAIPGARVRLPEPPAMPDTPPPALEGSDAILRSLMVMGVVWAFAMGVAALLVFGAVR